jgi:hypothetical protein
MQSRTFSNYLRSVKAQRWRKVRLRIVLRKFGILTNINLNNMNQAILRSGFEKRCNVSISGSRSWSRSWSGSWSCSGSRSRSGSRSWSGSRSGSWSRSRIY